MKMKTILFVLLFISILTNCNNPSNNYADNATERQDSTNIKEDTAAEYYYPDKKYQRAPVGSELKQYALNVLAGKQDPSDNLFTFAMYDSLCSPNMETRKFYYSVFAYSLPKADGAVSESLGSYIINYMDKYPAEALTNYQLLTKKSKNSYDELVAFEFYAGNANSYKGEIKEYFDGIRIKLSTDSNLLSTSKKLENTVLKIASEYIAEDAK